MPRSKRDKKVSLTQTNKKGLLLKQRIIEEIRKSLAKYEHVFLFTVDNMRNTKLKDLRSEWKDSRFFFGKNKVMAIALGKSKTDEVDDQLNLKFKQLRPSDILKNKLDTLKFLAVKKNKPATLRWRHKIIKTAPDFGHELSKKLKGQCGLLMTSKDVPDVLQWFKGYSDSEFARSGFKATKDVVLPKGPLEGFSHTIEPHLRRLGLPTSLERGVIHLVKEYQVCKKGAALTPEQASILKLLGIQMADFKIMIKCHWTKGKGYHKDLEVPSDEESNDEDNNIPILQDEDMEEDET